MQTTTGNQYFKEQRMDFMALNPSIWSMDSVRDYRNLQLQHSSMEKEWMGLVHQNSKVIVPMATKKEKADTSVVIEQLNLKSLVKNWLAMFTQTSYFLLEFTKKVTVGNTNHWNLFEFLPLDHSFTRYTCLPVNNLLCNQLVNDIRFARAPRLEIQIELPPKYFNICRHHQKFQSRQVEL